MGTTPTHDVLDKLDGGRTDASTWAQFLAKPHRSAGAECLHYNYR